MIGSLASPKKPCEGRPGASLVVRLRIAEGPGTRRPSSRQHNCGDPNADRGEAAPHGDCNHEANGDPAHGQDAFLSHDSASEGR